MVHLLVSELRRFQNARCNDKNCSKLFISNFDQYSLSTSFISIRSCHFGRLELNFYPVRTATLFISILVHEVNNDLFCDFFDFFYAAHQDQLFPVSSTS